MHRRVLTGVEALVRWRHPIRGLVPPSAFLSVAYEAGLMELVTDFVLDEATRQAVAWSAHTADGRAVSVAINVGARELETGRLRTRVAEALDDERPRSHLPHVEVTEGSLIHDLGRSALRLDALRALGVRTSLDDFGTGYSSLSYLSRLPIDELKIDRMFVQRMSAQPQSKDFTPPDRQLVEAIIQLASIFELDVVAEGIEHLGELEILREMGCHSAQGFLTGRPMVPTDEKLLGHDRWCSC